MGKRCDFAGDIANIWKSRPFGDRKIAVAIDTQRVSIITSAMPRTVTSIAFVASTSDEAQAARQKLAALYDNVSVEEADVIVALGGDGFVLQTLHASMNTGKLVYGMNRGSVGFLMNKYSSADLMARIAHAVENTIRPLKMQTTDADGNKAIAYAINEVSLFRQSYQAAKLRVVIDGHERLPELICDGLLLSTPAGSTAYNFSAHGPILPLEAPLMALTPVSAFRPRRWRGALLPERVKVEIFVLETEKRPVNAVADNTEIKSVVEVTIALSEGRSAKLLSDPDHSWSDRILAEQFID
jgi:NAD+ kinase